MTWGYQHRVRERVIYQRTCSNIIIRNLDVPEQRFSHDSRIELVKSVQVLMETSHDHYMSVSITTMAG